MVNQKSLFNPKGAGRKLIPLHKRKYVPHREREEIPVGKPVHVTIKLNRNVVTTLRNKVLFKKILRAITLARKKGMRLIHFTVQKDHLHLLIESKDKKQLAKSMQSLKISLAKSLIYLKQNTRIKIFKERYHVHILKTLREIKNAKNYILGNAAKHGVIKDKFDTFSSVIKAPEIAWCFDFEKYFRDLIHFLDYEKIIDDLVTPPEFYLTKKGML
jgi:REP element-mobilizing transposase RayT